MRNLLLNLDGGSLSSAVCSDLDYQLQRTIHEAKVQISKFSDGEWNIDIGETVRGCRVFVLCSIGSPVNDNLVKVCVACDALKRASVGEIDLVAPYLGYSRQDRRVLPRQPISARMVADVLQVVGVSRLITVDMHAAQICGFYGIPVDNITAIPVLAESAKEYCFRTFGEHWKSQVVVVSPDHGGVSRARDFADCLGVGDMAIIDKRRTSVNEVASMNVIGNVKNKVCVIVDDLVDTGGTLKMADVKLRECGAVDVVCYCTHAVLSKGGLGSSIKLFVTDTLAEQDGSVVVSIARYLSSIIEAVAYDESVSRVINSYRGK